MSLYRVRLVRDDALVPIRVTEVHQAGSKPPMFPTRLAEFTLSSATRAPLVLLAKSALFDRGADAHEAIAEVARGGVLALDGMIAPEAALVIGDLMGSLPPPTRAKRESFDGVEFLRRTLELMLDWSLEFPGTRWSVVTMGAVAREKRLEAALKQVGLGLRREDDPYFRRSIKRVKRKKK